MMAFLRDVSGAVTPMQERRIPLVHLALALGVGAISLVAFAAAEPLVILGGTVAVVGAITLFFSRPVMLCAFVSVLYAGIQGEAEALSTISILGVGVNGAQAFGVAVTALLALRLLVHVAVTPGAGKLPPFFLPMSALVAMSVLASVMSPEPPVAAAALFRVVAVFTILMFGYLTTTDARTFRIYMVTAGISSLVVAISALSESVFQRGPTEILRVGAFRAEGSVGTSSTGAICFVGIVVFIYFLERWDPRYRWLSFAGISLLGFGLFASFVRAAILGSALFLIWSMLPSHVSSKRGSAQFRNLIVVMLAFAALSTGLLVVDDATMQARLHDIPVLGSMQNYDPDVGSGRIRIWTGVLSALTQNSPIAWVVGNGMFSTMEANRRIIGAALTSHNSYLSLLYDQGILGLAIYLSFLVTILRALAAAAKLGGDLGSVAGHAFRLLVCFAVTVDMFGSTIYTLADRWYLYLLVGSILGMASSQTARGSVLSAATPERRAPAPLS